MKTPLEFQKHYQFLIENTDLLFNLPRILQGLLDRDGVIACEYGLSMDDGIDNKWFIDVEDTSFWYSTFEERNKDIKILSEIVNVFRKENGLSCENSIYML